MSFLDTWPQAVMKVLNNGSLCIFVLEKIGNHMGEIVDALKGCPLFIQQADGLFKIGSAVFEESSGKNPTLANTLRKNSAIVSPFQDSSTAVATH
ncbi:MAG: hypothetical protein IPH35_27500 [Rhodoferax sp.]|nr:hypothetical protein [Rhodoferax sp.]